MSEEVGVVLSGALDADKVAELLAEMSPETLTAFETLIDQGILSSENFYKLLANLSLDAGDEVTDLASGLADGADLTQVNIIANVFVSGDIAADAEAAVKSLEGTAEETAEAAKTAGKVADEVSQNGVKGIEAATKDETLLGKAKSWLVENPGKALLGLTGIGLAIWLAVSPGSAMDDLGKLTKAGVRNLGGILTGVAQAVGQAAGAGLKGFFGSIGHILLVVGASIAGLIVISVIAYLIYKRYQGSSSSH